MKISAVGFLVVLCSVGCSESSDSECGGVGNICTIAGSGENGYFGDDGSALKARLSLPQDTLTAADGSMYILDWNNHRIRKLTPDGVIHHVAGRGELGGTLDDPANSDFNHPTAMAFDPSGEHLFIAAWHNSKIRSIELATGTIVDNCGDGRRAYFGDETSALTASLDSPTSLVFDANHDLIIMDQANQVMRRLDASGVIHHYAGKCIIDSVLPPDRGPCTGGTESVACPMPSGKHTCGNPAATCGGPCSRGYSGDDIPALDMRIAQPFGQSADPGGRILFDGDGNLLFADTSNALIRKIDTHGIVRRIAGVPPQNGLPQTGYSGDGGPALEAKLNNPVDLALSDDGTLFFTDVYNHCVRAIDSSGTSIQR